MYSEKRDEAASMSASYKGLEILCPEGPTLTWLIHYSAPRM